MLSHIQKNVFIVTKYRHSDLEASVLHQRFTVADDFLRSFLLSAFPSMTPLILYYSSHHAFSSFLTSSSLPIPPHPLTFHPPPPQPLAFSPVLPSPPFILSLFTYLFCLQIHAHSWFMVWVTLGYMSGCPPCHGDADS